MSKIDERRHELFRIRRELKELERQVAVQHQKYYEMQEELLSEEERAILGLQDHMQEVGA
jgi:hypothetical protein